MSDDFATRHWLNLSLTVGVGDKSMRKLLRVFQSPGAVLRATTMELKTHVNGPTAQNIKEQDNTTAIDNALKWLRHPDHHIITIVDKDYPPMLLEIDGPPMLLYVVGDVCALSKTAVAIVGSRNASPAGVSNTIIFARELANAGVVVVSGMAQGIDTAAHRGALSGAAGTVAIMGTGMDLIYPKENRDMAAQIAKHGALISELPLGTKPVAGNFPRRNRLISGLARACLVVEATAKSGSLITAQTAMEQGRDVFAVPGSINSPMHRGCHKLIKEGAKLAENIYDILEELKYQATTQHKMNEETAADNDHQLLEYIGFDATSFDQIAARSGLDAATVSSLLTELEIAKKIAPLPGDKYQRLP